MPPTLLPLVRMISAALLLAMPLVGTPLLAASLHEDGAEPSSPTSTRVEVRGRMPRAVTSFGAEVLHGHVYVLGGYFGIPHQYDWTGQSGDFLRMSLADGTWELLPSPGRMQSVTLETHGGRLYRIGGMIAKNDPGEDEDLVSSDAFARFDPLERSWTALPPLPAPRSSHESTVIGDHLYVVAGWILGGKDAQGPPQWHDTMLRLDLSNPDAAWESIEMPFQRRALGVTSVGERLVVIGGITSEGKLSSSLDVYDTATGLWSEGPDFPQGGFGLACQGRDGAVYASAGDGGVYSWAPGAESWESITSWAFPRFFHQLVSPSAGELLAVGGVARGGRIAHQLVMQTTREY